MNREQLEERIAEFPHWNYKFDFDNGASTPLHDPKVVNRHKQRRRYFSSALVGLFGGSLSGHRVLDLGCGAGFWALEAIEAGADFVLGIDAHATSIEQAKLVFEGKGIEPARYGFERANIFEHELPGSFDIVLCVGLMHVIAKPVELFELMQRAGAEVIVVETELSQAPSSFFELASNPNPKLAVDHQLALIPTRQAVVELAEEFGYRTVALARNMTDYAGMDDYRRRRRLAFICSNGRSLSSLAAEEPWPSQAWRAALDPRALLQRRGR